MSLQSSRHKAAHSAHHNVLLRSFQGSLESLRAARGLSHRRFAASLGLPRSTYSRLISAAANPSLETIEWIAERAGVSPLSMLGAATNAGRSDEASPTFDGN